MAGCLAECLTGLPACVGSSRLNVALVELCPQKVFVFQCYTNKSSGVVHRSE